MLVYEVEAINWGQFGSDSRVAWGLCRVGLGCLGWFRPAGWLACMFAYMFTCMLACLG